MSPPKYAAASNRSFVGINTLFLHTFCYSTGVLETWVVTHVCVYITSDGVKQYEVLFTILFSV